MSASYITAGVVSLVLGIVTVSVPRYQYWFHYVPRWRRLGCLAGQMVTYVAAGLLVALVAHAAGDKSAYGESWLTGLIYGCVPHGLARVPLPGMPMQNLRDPKAPLGRVLFWITEWADSAAKKMVEREIIDLKDHPARLEARALDVYWYGYYADRKLETGAKDLQKELLKDAIGKLNGTERADGIGCLTNFCIGEITSRYLLPRG